MWRVVGGSVVGTNHATNAISCQDYHICAYPHYGEHDILVAVVADGAGSARYAGDAAEIVGDNVFRRITLFLDCGSELGSVTKDDVETWLRKTRRHLEQKAAERQCSVRDFACTIIGLIADEQSIVCFQIGDGAIVLETAQQPLSVAFWPDSGEYANETYFLTDENFEDHLRFLRIEEVPLDVAIVSDGLQRMALDYRSREPHYGFFSPMFAQLAQQQCNRPLSLEQGLKAFLDSDGVNSRTDDDKTLVVATRRTLEQAQSGN